jgi:hypothetical protein
LLDELVRVLVHGLDAGLQEIVLRTAANFGHEHRRAVVDSADYGFQAVFVAEAALAIEVHAAMADEFRSGGA